MTEDQVRTRYRGVNRYGTAVTGVIAESVDLIGWVNLCYRMGWRKLVVTWGDIEVGRIGESPDTGHRTWWAES